MNSPYAQKSGAVRLVRSFVCYADILGYTTLSKAAIESGEGLQFLERLRKALSGAYDRMRESSKGWGQESFYAVKVFTDNVVVGYPLFGADSEFGEPELAHILSIFAEFQAGLAAGGFLVRGGIALGPHYMDDDIVFGGALLEAVEVDQSGGAPRITLTASAVKILQRQLGFYGRTDHAPQYADLLQDADGSVFLNYLGEAFVAFPDGGIYLDLIERHRQVIVEGLETYKGNAGVRSKYEWAARYHNFVCKDFVQGHPVPSNPDADEQYAAANVEAQKLLQYLIDIESVAPTPTRITLAPIIRR